MAKLFIISVGNFLDDTTYPIPVIVPDDYRECEVQAAIDCNGIEIDKENERVIWICESKPKYVAFIEDDFLCIEPTLKDFKLVS